MMFGRKAGGQGGRGYRLNKINHELISVGMELGNGHTWVDCAV